MDVEDLNYAQKEQRGDLWIKQMDGSTSTATFMCIPSASQIEAQLGPTEFKFPAVVTQAIRQVAAAIPYEGKAAVLPPALPANSSPDLPICAGLHEAVQRKTIGML